MNNKSTMFINVNNVKFRSSRSGKGTSFFCIPGGPGFGDYLEPFANLIDDFLEVIRYEPRGCGKSDNTPPFDIMTNVRDIEAIREYLGFDKWIIGGHSAGATSALAYALEYPQHVLSVIYFAGVGVQSNKKWLEEVEKNFKELGEDQPDFEFPINEEVQQSINKSWEKYIEQPKLWYNLAHLQIPFLIIQGEKDIRPNWPVIQLSNLLPQSTYHEIKGAGHWFWGSHPNELREIIHSFISDNDLLIV